jgi:hypothetical protein
MNKGQDKPEKIQLAFTSIIKIIKSLQLQFEVY